MIKYLQPLSRNNNLYPCFFNFTHRLTVYFRVGNDIIDLVEVADFPKAATIKFRTVCQHHHGLRKPDHLLVQARFYNIRDRKAMFQINAIHAQEQHST